MSLSHILETTDQTLERAGNHIIGSVRGLEPGSTLILLGGIHGNEPAGVVALRRALLLLEEKQLTIRGEVVFLAGNTRALLKGWRYVDADLNRKWTAPNIRGVRADRVLTSESLEQQELLAELDKALTSARGEVYFVDLHTTSASGIPFATIGDTLRNRRFAVKFPGTIVLGLEEQIDGTLLEYLNNLGAVTMGFEAGQHLAESSVRHHEAVIWIAMIAAGNLRAEDVPDLSRHRATLGGKGGSVSIVEVRHRHPIRGEDRFRMEPGFANFQRVKKGELLARDHNGQITARESGMVLLPLYQALGDDGFFLGREVRPLWLKLSAILRRLRVGDYAHWLPGVRRDPENEMRLLVNTQIARILPLQIFHLLGFRKRRWSRGSLVVSRRRYDMTPPVTSTSKSRESQWHTLAVEGVFESLKSSSAGLTSVEADRRITQYGPNELQSTRRVSAWEVLLRQFKNVLIIILLAATLISAFLGHELEAIAIAVIVMFAALLGFVQEYRAERAMEALRQMAAPSATVIRDDLEREIPARDLVPGDVMLLTTGDKVAADARLFEAINLHVEESALTGESIPVTKLTLPLNKQDLAIGDRKNMAFSGTTLTYGRGRAVVVATGANTEFGKIASMLEAVETGKTPLQKNLDRVGRSLAWVALVMVAVIVALGILRGQPLIDMFIFGVALAVAVVPEALPAVVTISLAMGVKRMVKRNALVRHLPAVETLGSTSVICSDKTGTLTKDEMTIRKIYVGGQMLEVSGTGYETQGSFSLEDGSILEPTKPLLSLLRAATLASDARIVCEETSNRWQVKGDPTEGALVVAAAKAGLHKADLDSEFPRVDEIPFTSESKRMTTLHKEPAGIVAYSKGAPEVILKSCNRQLTKDSEGMFDEASAKKLLEVAEAMASDALRVLAVSLKRDATLETAEREMTFLGLVGMIDPPRPEVQAAIRQCEDAGIKVVMITGDHVSTAKAIARELGLLKTGCVVSGAELETIGDEAFKSKVEGIEVYARVSPAHKLRVVSALQERGHVAAMTGDGVNDAPALKKADLGIAMGITGTDVTKEAAAMTLTDDNFASIVAAVEEGRAIFSNIKKYLMYLLSSNIGEIGLMAGASLLGLPLPLSAVQLLYVNLATDGLPALALAVDPPESDLMQRPPRNPRTGIFIRPVVILMTVGGLWSTGINLGLFIWALNSGRSVQEAMTMTFVSLVLIQFFKAYNFRSDRRSVLDHPFANKWLNLAIGWELMMLALIIYVPLLHEMFDTFSLPPSDWLIIVSLAFTVSPVLELAKWMERRGWFGRM